MSPFVVFMLLIHLTSILDVEAIGAGVPAIQKNDENKEEVVEPVKKEGEIVVDLSGKNVEAKDPKEPVPANKPSTELVPLKNNNVSINTTTTEHKKFRTTEVMESGALVRGVLVVVALSVIVMIYMAVKTYYGKRNRPLMVRKYGIRTRRSDIEMTPLPLDDDDEDETLFEVGNANR